MQLPAEAQQQRRGEHEDPQRQHPRRAARWPTPRRLRHHESERQPHSFLLLKENSVSNRPDRYDSFVTSRNQPEITPGSAPGTSPGSVPGTAQGTLRALRNDPVARRIILAWRRLTAESAPRTLVACSGGGDSVALGVALAAAQPDAVTLAHIVHDMRPIEQAERDRDFVRALA
ncbi:MAG: hypothetical protein EA380_03290, partial [Phycisphaeraceae bacterium]